MNIIKKRRISAIVLTIIMLISRCKHKVDCSEEFSNNNVVEFADVEDKFDSIIIGLPDGWQVTNEYKTMFNMIDNKGDKKGDIWVFEYTKDFELMKQQPNHSIVTNDEEIDIPIGKVRIIALDSDNGSAASGLVGTHDEYYACVSVNDKEIYLLTLNNNDKNLESKNLFISILKSTRLK